VACYLRDEALIEEGSRIAGAGTVGLMLSWQQLMNHMSDVHASQYNALLQLSMDVANENEFIRQLIRMISQQRGG
jgi:hypothetical protein